MLSFSEDTMTRRALLVMEDGFDSGEHLRVTFLDKANWEIASYIS